MIARGGGRRHDLDRPYNGAHQTGQGSNESSASEHRTGLGDTEQKKGGRGFRPPVKARLSYSDFSSASRAKMNVCAWSASLATSGRSSRPKLSVS